MSACRMGNVISLKGVIALVILTYWICLKVANSLEGSLIFIIFKKLFLIGHFELPLHSFLKVNSFNFN